MTGVPSKFGKKFEDYLREDYDPDETLSDLDMRRLESQDTITKILARKDVTPAILYDLTRLVLIPESLLLLPGTKTLPALMFLFQEYSHENPIYTYEFGFHCVEAILLMLGIGALAEADSLQKYLAHVRGLPDARHPRTLHSVLGNHIAEVLASDNRVRGWSFCSTEVPLIPTLGGFTWEDVKYFVLLIWYCRERIFQAHTINGVSPNWCYGIFILWVCNRTVMRDHAIDNALYAIAIRLELNNPQSLWGDLIRQVIVEPQLSQPNPSVPIEGSQPIDSDDARLILQQYYAYITLPGHRDYRNLIRLGAWTMAVVSTIDEVEAHLRYLKSHTRSLWSMILHSAEPERGYEKVVNVMSLIHLAGVTVIVAERAAHNPTQKALLCLEMLFSKCDFVNLMGCVLLWPTREEFLKIQIPEFVGTILHQLETVLSAITVLVTTVRPLVPRLQETTRYNPTICADWTKVSKFLQGFIQTNHPLYVQQLDPYLEACRAAWKQFGQIVPFLSTNRCDNPDCKSGLRANVTCNRCKGVFYCSEQCQKRHQDYPITWRAHSFECGLERLTIKT